jgi:hypothetical protein
VVSAVDVGSSSSSIISINITFITLFEGAMLAGRDDEEAGYGSGDSIEDNDR